MNLSSNVGPLWLDSCSTTTITFGERHLSVRNTWSIAPPLGSWAADSSVAITHASSCAWGETGFDVGLSLSTNVKPPSVVTHGFPVVASSPSAWTPAELPLNLESPTEPCRSSTSSSETSLGRFTAQSRTCAWGWEHVPTELLPSPLKCPTSWKVCPLVEPTLPRLPSKELGWPPDPLNLLSLARSGCNRITELIATASPVLTLNNSISKFSSCACTGWNWNGMSSFSASIESRCPVCSNTALLSLTPVMRRCGGPPGRTLKACSRASHWTGSEASRSIKCTTFSPSIASRMAWLTVRKANFKYGQTLKNTCRAESISTIEGSCVEFRALYTPGHDFVMRAASPSMK